MQVSLHMVWQLLDATRRTGQATLCSHVLQTLDAESLLQSLTETFILNDTAAYGSRLAALQLLSQIVTCVGDSWRFSGDPHAQPGDSSLSPAEAQGTCWDAASVGCLGAVVRHVCMPKHDTRLGGFRDKALLKEGLHCLQQITAAVPDTLWCAAWAQVCVRVRMTQHYRVSQCSINYSFKQ